MILCPPPCREVDGIIEYGMSTGVPMVVTSTYRPGAVTLSGNPSRHGKKLAVDFAWIKPSWDSDQLADIFAAFVPVQSHLFELIHAGPKIKYNIKAGKEVPKYAVDIHHNHVHVSVDPGIYLPDLVNIKITAVVSNTPVHITEANERTDLVPAITVHRPQGGYAVLQSRDGGVFTYDDAPFFGSLVNVSPGPAVALEWTESGQGYWILDSHGAVFAFGDAQYKGGVNGPPLDKHFANRIPVGLIRKGNGYVIIGQDISGDNSPFDSYQLPV